MPVLNLPQAVREQLLRWLTEPQGLEETLLDPAFLANPENLVPRADLGGLSLLEETTAQRDAYQFLIARDGRNVNRNDFLPAWITTFELIRASYNRAHDLEYEISSGGTRLRRASLRDFFDDLFVRSGGSSDRPVLSEAETRAPGPPPGTQFAEPNANRGSANGWTQVAGDGDGDWFDEIDEGIDGGTPDDNTTYWQSVTNPATPTNDLSVELQDVTDPTSSTGHILKSRVKKNSGSGRQIDHTLHLEQNGTAIASTTFTDIGGGSSAWSTKTLTLTGGEADSITDYSLLNVRLVFATVGGGAGREAHVTATEFQCPDAVAAPSMDTWFRETSVPIFPRLEIRYLESVSIERVEATEGFVDFMGSAEVPILPKPPLLREEISEPLLEFAAPTVVIDWLTDIPIPVFLPKPTPATYPVTIERVEATDGLMDWWREVSQPIFIPPPVPLPGSVTVERAEPTEGLMDWWREVSQPIFRSPTAPLPGSVSIERVEATEGLLDWWREVSQPIFRAPPVPLPGSVTVERVEATEGLLDWEGLPDPIFERRRTNLLGAHVFETPFVAPEVVVIDWLTEPEIPVRRVPGAELLGRNLVDPPLGIVKITHDDGTESEWDFENVSGGDFAVTTAARMGESPKGLEVQIATVAVLFKRKNLRKAHTGGRANFYIRTGFYLDPNGMTVGSLNNDQFNVMEWASGGGANTVGRCRLIRDDSSPTGYSLNAAYDQDTPIGSAVTPTIAFPNEETLVEIEVKTASSAVAADGWVKLWLNKRVRTDPADAEIKNLDIFTDEGVDTIEFGVCAGQDAGLAGTFYIDDVVVMYSDQFIGGRVFPKLPSWEGRRPEPTRRRRIASLDRLEGILETPAPPVVPSMDTWFREASTPIFPRPEIRYLESVSVERVEATEGFVDFMGSSEVPIVARRRLEREEISEPLRDLAVAPVSLDWLSDIPLPAFPQPAAPFSLIGEPILPPVPFVPLDWIVSQEIPIKRAPAIIEGLFVSDTTTPPPPVVPPMDTWFREVSVPIFPIPPRWKQSVFQQLLDLPEPGRGTELLCTDPPLSGVDLDCTQAVGSGVNISCPGPPVSGVTPDCTQAVGGGAQISCPSAPETGSPLGCE